MPLAEAPLGSCSTFKPAIGVFVCVTLLLGDTSTKVLFGHPKWPSTLALYRNDSGDGMSTKAGFETYSP